MKGTIERNETVVNKVLDREDRILYQDFRFILIFQI